MNFRNKAAIFEIDKDGDGSQKTKAIIKIAQNNPANNLVVLYSAQKKKLVKNFKIKFLAIAWRCKQIDVEKPHH